MFGNSYFLWLHGVSLCEHQQHITLSLSLSLLSLTIAPSLYLYLFLSNTLSLFFYLSLLFLSLTIYPSTTIKFSLHCTHCILPLPLDPASPSDVTIYTNKFAAKITLSYNMPPSIKCWRQSLETITREFMSKLINVGYFPLLIGFHI